MHSGLKNVLKQHFYYLSDGVGNIINLSFFPVLVKSAQPTDVWHTLQLIKARHCKDLLASPLNEVSWFWQSVVFTSVWPAFISKCSMLASHCGAHTVLGTPCYYCRMQISLGSWWVTLVQLLLAPAAPRCQQILPVEWSLEFLANLKELSGDLLLLSIARTSNWHDLIPTQAQSLQPNAKD